MPESTEDRLKKLVAEQLGTRIEEIKPESRFIEDMGADSLDAVEMVMAIEDEFSIEIDDEKAEGLQTFQQLVDFVEEVVNKKQ